jgi:hypothetical protein
MPVNDGNGTPSDASQGARKDTQRPPVREYQVVLGPGFGAARAMSMVAEAYSMHRVLRRTTIAAAAVFLLGLVALLFLRTEGLPIAIVAASLSVIPLFAQPIRLFAGIARLREHAASRGSNYAARYGAESFKIRHPSRAVDQYRYSEILDLHARGSFFFFRLRDGGAVQVVLPIGILPHGEITWLRARVHESMVRDGCQIQPE